jgi:putative DNA-directed RNA polymerase, omega subunit
LALILVINITGKGNLSPSSASDQVQNYVLGGIIGGVIYNKEIAILEYISILFIWCMLVLS